MTRGTRLLLMMLILVAVVIGMTKCMQMTVRKKKAVAPESRGPAVHLILAGSGP
jgi:hypothetical protein